jgi:hypothetical protein
VSRRTIILAITAALTVLTTTTDCGLFGIGHSDAERGQYDERYVLLNKPRNTRPEAILTNWKGAPNLSAYEPSTRD